MKIQTKSSATMEKESLKLRITDSLILSLPNVFCIHCSAQNNYHIKFHNKGLGKTEKLSSIHTPDNFIMTVICSNISYVLLPLVDSHHSTLKMDIYSEVTGTEG